MLTVLGAIKAAHARARERVSAGGADAGRYRDCQEPQNRLLQIFPGPGFPPLVGKVCTTADCRTLSNADSRFLLFFVMLKSR